MLSKKDTEYLLQMLTSEDMTIEKIIDLKDHNVDAYLIIYYFNTDIDDDDQQKHYNSLIFDANCMIYNHSEAFDYPKNFDEISDYDWRTALGVDCINVDGFPIPLR